MARTDKVKEKEYLKKWRQSESGKASVQKYRDKTKEQRALKAKEYYKKNREKILAKTKEYHEKNPHIRKKAVDKFRESGGSKEKGRRDRSLLKDAYVMAQIRAYPNGRMSKDLEKRKYQILKQRLIERIEKLGNEKACKTCYKLKPLSDFNRHGVFADTREPRYQPHCKKCYSELRKKYKWDKQKQKETNKRYYLNNKEKIQQRQKIWREKHNNIKKPSV